MPCGGGDSEAHDEVRGIAYEGGHEVASRGPLYMSATHPETSGVRVHKHTSEVKSRCCPEKKRKSQGRRWYSTAPVVQYTLDPAHGGMQVMYDGGTLLRPLSPQFSTGIDEWCA